jgi:hypothetical protein
MALIRNKPLPDVSTLPRLEETAEVLELRARRAAVGATRAKLHEELAAAVHTRLHATNEREAEAATAVVTRVTPALKELDAQQDDLRRALHALTQPDQDMIRKWQEAYTAAVVPYLEALEAAVAARDKLNELVAQAQGQRITSLRGCHGLHWGLDTYVKQTRQFLHTESTYL